PRLHDRQLRHRDGGRAAGYVVGHLHGRPPRRLLVLLPVVLPCPAHGDEGADAGRTGLTANRRCMVSRSRAAAAFLAVLVFAVAEASPAVAAEVRIAPGDPVQPWIDGAAPGDVVRLAPGEHAGPLTIGRSIALVGDS